LNQPELARRVASLQPEGRIEVTISDTGEPTAVMRLKDGGQKRLHSRRDPRRDADLWVQTIHHETFQATALLGLGLGYPLEEFLKIHHEATKCVWCFESSLEVFKAMLSWRDWTPILQNPNIRFFVGVDEFEFRRLASGGFQQVIVDGIDIHEYPPSIQCDPAWYDERKINIRDLIRQWTS